MIEDGELTSFTADGYYLTFLANTTVPDYLEVIDAAKDVLFGYGNRGIKINFTLYSVKVDWWINV